MGIFLMNGFMQIVGTPNLDVPTNQMRGIYGKRI